MTKPSEQETREYVDKVEFDERMSRYEQEQERRGKQIDDLVKLADDARRWWIGRQAGMWQDPPGEGP